VGLSESGSRLRALLSVPAVALTKELAEAMRWRSMEWAHIPALTRKLAMPYLTAREPGHRGE
jgi:hypothetical protein